MTQRQKAAPRTPLSVGTVSLVLVFVMLCLITFAVLALVSAQANLRLSRKSAERTAAYYTAENAANDVLIDLNAILQEKWPAAPTAPAYYAAVREAARELEVTFTDDTHLTWQVPLDENQTLQVAAELAYQPFADGRHYRILTWQAQNTYAWDGEQPLDLMDPGTLPGQ